MYRKGDASAVFNFVVVSFVSLRNQVSEMCLASVRRRTQSSVVQVMPMRYIVPPLFDLGSHVPSFPVPPYYSTVAKPPFAINTARHNVN